VSGGVAFIKATVSSFEQVAGGPPFGQAGLFRRATTADQQQAKELLILGIGILAILGLVFYSFRKFK